MIRRNNCMQQHLPNAFLYSITSRSSTCVAAWVEGISFSPDLDNVKSWDEWLEGKDQYLSTKFDEIEWLKGLLILSSSTVQTGGRDAMSKKRFETWQRKTRHKRTKERLWNFHLNHTTLAPGFRHSWSMNWTNSFLARVFDGKKDPENVRNPTLLLSSASSK